MLFLSRDNGGLPGFVFLELRNGVAGMLCEFLVPVSLGSIFSKNRSFGHWLSKIFIIILLIDIESTLLSHLRLFFLLFCSIKGVHVKSSFGLCYVCVKRRQFSRIFLVRYIMEIFMMRILWPRFSRNFWKFGNSFARFYRQVGTLGCLFATSYRVSSLCMCSYLENN